MAITIMGKFAQAQAGSFTGKTGNAGLDANQKMLNLVVAINFTRKEVPKDYANYPRKQEAT